MQDYRQTQHDVKIMVRELNLKYLSNKNKYVYLYVYF